MIYRIFCSGSSSLAWAVRVVEVFSSDIYLKQKNIKEHVFYQVSICFYCLAELGMKLPPECSCLVITTSVGLVIS